MFVVVVDDETGKIEKQYSYGPQRSFPMGKLVSQGKGDSIYQTDESAFVEFQKDPEAAMKNGISAVQIDASDDAVIASGDAVSRSLGDKNNPGPINYAPVTGPQSTSDFANSNSAAYAVADRAVKSENPRASQSLPRGTHNPGWGQSDHIPKEALPTGIIGDIVVGKRCSGRLDC